MPPPPPSHVQTYSITYDKLRAQIMRQQILSSPVTISKITNDHTYCVTAMIEKCGSDFY